MINRLDETARTFRNVQGLRAIAALLVLSVHLNGIEQKLPNPSGILQWLYPLGEYGVDLFFVISGFVMITSTWNEFTAPAISVRFFLRRITRVYPPYWIVMLPIVALFIVSPMMVNGSQAIRPNVPATLLLLPQIGKPLLTVSWTLVYEMFFYVVFAFVLAFDRRWCLPFMAAWGVLTLALAALLSNHTNIWVGTYTNPLLLEFILGVFCGYLVKVRGVQFPIVTLALGVIGIGLADVYYAGIDTALHADGGLRFLFVGVPMLLFFNGVVGLETSFGYVLPNVLQQIGNASYTLYLWHVPISIFLARFALKARIAHSHVLTSLWLIAVAVIIVAASMMLYRWIERPLLKRSGKWIRTLDDRLAGVHTTIPAAVPQ
jgi:exopolysaccharide production protein ExoZ